MLPPKNIRRIYRDKLVGKLVFPVIRFIRGFKREGRKRIAHVVARLIFTFARKTRRRAINNVTQAFPFITPVEAELLAISAYENIVFGVFECFWLEEVPYQVHMTDEAKALLESKNGLVVATMHMGCYEIVPYVVQKLTGRSTTMSKIPDFIPDGLSVYQQSGIYCVNKKESGGFLKLVNSVKTGDVVSLHSDHYATDTKVRFFGRKTQAPCGAAMLSALTKAPLLIAYGVLDHNDTYQVYFECVEAGGVNPQHNGVEWAMREVYQRFEKIILQFPEQWYWSYNRWREE